MRKEKSAGAVVYRLEHGIPMYLLLHYPSSGRSKKEYWDLPKGHMEQGETEQETVQREVREETGISSIKFLEGFSETIHYWFEWEGEKISKTVVFFAAQTHEKRVKISEEHVGFLWLPYEDAIRQLTYKNAKQVVKKAHDFFSAKGI